MNPFFAQVQWSRAQSAARAKPRGWAEKGGMVVTLEEVIKAAQELYPELNMSLSAARTWVARKLIPAPEIESKGRGKGTQANYSEDTPAQMAAAAYTAAQGYTQKQIALARRIVLEGMPTEGELMTAVACMLGGGVNFFYDPKYMSAPTREALAICGATSTYGYVLALALEHCTVTDKWPANGFVKWFDVEGREFIKYDTVVLGPSFQDWLEAPLPDGSIPYSTEEG